VSFGSSSLPNPTKAEALRHRLIIEGGCIACWLYAELHTACEVHHLTTGGKHGQLRRGHAFTLGICPWHHRGVGSKSLIATVGPSYQHTPRKFREVFGTDDELMVVQARILRQVHNTYLISPGIYA